MSMNVSEPKERATFSIAADIKGRLDQAVPKSERSRFVEKAIDQALRDISRGRVKAMLDNLPLAASAGESGAEFLQRKRLEWDGRSIDVLEGRDE
jgi:hypothetical protein